MFVDEKVSFKATWWKLLIYGLIYTIFTIIFNFVSGTPVYDVLDWKSNFGGAFVAASGIIVLTLVFYGVLCWTNNLLMKRRSGNMDMSYNKEMYVEMDDNEVVNTMCANDSL